LYGGDAFHDAPYASAFAVFNAQDLQGIPDLLSWWTFTDVFEEGGFISRPFHGGFGLQNIHGIAKPSFRAFELLHRSGNEKIYMKSYDYSTVGSFVTRMDSEIQIVAFNYNYPNGTIRTESACIILHGISTSEFKEAFLERIDDTHANAPNEWKIMGSPEYLDEYQVEHLKKVSRMVKEKIVPVVISSNSLSFTVTIPPQGVIAITFSL